MCSGDSDDNLVEHFVVNCGTKLRFPLAEVAAGQGAGHRWPHRLVRVEDVRGRLCVHGGKVLLLVLAY